MSLEHVTLLCVEDDSATLDAMKTLLEGEVKALYLASDGREGLEAFKEHEPDIVVTDIAMPRMSGIEMARQIKEIDPHRPVAMVTAYDDKSHLEKAVNIGINKYIYKPIVADSLLDTLEQLADVVQKTDRMRSSLSGDDGNRPATVNPLEIALDGADSGFFDWNIATDRLVCGPVFDRTFQTGDKDSPTTFEQWVKTWHPDDAAMMTSELTEYIQSQRSTPFNRRVRMSNAAGEWLSISFRGKSYTDDDGEPHFAGIVEDITEQSKREQVILDRSKFDTVTGVLAHAAFSDRLTRKMADAHFLLCFISVDKLDAIRSSLGPTRTDRILKTTAQRIETFRNDGDLLGRIRQDSFGLTVTVGDRSAEPSTLLAALVEKLKEPIDCYGRRVTITTNIGVVPHSPEAGFTVDGVIHHAMLAMYENTTRDTDYFLDDIAGGRLEEADRLIHRFDAAIERDELRLVYQPKVNMSTGELAGLEALVRWEHPERGLLTPGSFLPFIENDHRIMKKLGEWVFTSAFGQLMAWKHEGFDTSISLNVSAGEFEDDGVLIRLQSMFHAHPTIDPEAVEIEVLETQAVKNMGEFSTQLQSCRALGVRVAIDDFGTGYASLNYLKNFPWDTLKIDQSFVRDIVTNSRSSSIVELSVKLAGAFDSGIVAEGVEDEACGVTLRRFGCDVAQGYAICRPIPPEAVVEWYEHWEPFPSWQSVPE